MTKRYTVAQAEAVAQILARQLGKPWHERFSPQRREIGMWYLSYEPDYGGVIICEAIPSNPPGGIAEHHPLTEYRLLPGEFVRALNLAMRAITIAQVEAQMSFKDQLARLNHDHDRERQRLLQEAYK